MKPGDTARFVTMLDALTLACPGAMLQSEKNWLGHVESVWKLCPFADGARVRLRETPEISDVTAPGWRGAKHFLVKDALGTVRDRAFFDGVFFIGVVFDDETWVHPTTKELLRPEMPAAYTFAARWLEPAP